MALTAWPRLPSMKVPLFDNGSVYLCRNFDEWRAVHTAAGVAVDEELHLSSGLCRYIYHRNKRRFIVCVNNGKASTLAHELAHTCFEICSLVGVPCREGEGNETFCYLLGALMGHFLPYLVEPVTQ